MDFELTADFAQKMDDEDPLRSWRQRFLFPEPGADEVVYFVGHSLGLQPDTTRAAIEQELDAWATFGVDGHFKAKNPWVSYHEILAPPMAKIVGANASEVVCMNSLTVNLHLMLISFYQPTAERYKIICEGKLFPSDRYMLDTHLRFRGIDPNDAVIEVPPREGEYLIREEDILSAIEANSDQLAMLFLGGINFFTGQLFDIAKLTQAAHAVGAIAAFDLAHAAGNVPLELHDWDVDFAAWCSYKYLNASPGNVGAIFVHERHSESLDLPRFGGWWGHDKATRFKMEYDFRPMEGAEGWQISNVAVLGMAAMKASIDITNEAGMPALRQKSEVLTGYLEYTIDRLAEEFPDARINMITPRDPAQRGCQLSINVAGRNRELFESMLAANIFCDFREPDVIRLAPVPLYNSFADVYRFGEKMRELLA